MLVNVTLAKYYQIFCSYFCNIYFVEPLLFHVLGFNSDVPLFLFVICLLVLSVSNSLSHFTFCYLFENISDYYWYMVYDWLSFNQEERTGACFIKCLQIKMWEL